MSTLTVARKNVARAVAETRRLAVAAEVERLDRASAEKRASEQAARRAALADAAEAKVRETEAPVVTVKYRGRLIRVHVSDHDPVLRQTGLNAVHVITRYIALDVENRARQARAKALGAVIEQETSIDQLLAFLLDGELVLASTNGLIEVTK